MDFFLLLKIFAKNISNKYSQKLVDSVKKSATEAIKTASKRAIYKTAETTGDLIGTNNADMITSISKKFPKELHPKEFPLNQANNETLKEIYISPEERQQIIDELRLI